VAQHGRKTWFDHLVEFDPGRADSKIASNYPAAAPERIAVLPFIDRGSAQYRVDKIAVTHRDQALQAKWAWTCANRLRRSIAGQLAEREFTIVLLPEIDIVLQEHVDNWTKLSAVPPGSLDGGWLLTPSFTAKCLIATHTMPSSSPMGGGCPGATGFDARR
jgi:hypothetical protein